MSVAKRKYSEGRESHEYHYEFYEGKKRYRGVCVGCTTKALASVYEREVRAKVKELSKQKSAIALVENFKHELTGSEAIPLSNAFDLFLKKPRKRAMEEKQKNQKRNQWNDFLEFMQQTYPDIQHLDQVQECHAEEYIQMLRTSGRFNKILHYSINGEDRTCDNKQNANLSPRTINLYQQTITEVFNLLARDAGIIHNPFDQIPKLKNETGAREAFSQEELLTIRDKADEFTQPLFVIAVATALREGDICTLRWSEIDLQNDVIHRTMNKTKNMVDIPIMYPLKLYLQGLEKRAMEDKNKSEYVLPKHAEMYLKNPSGVSYRIKQFLEVKCGIQTTKLLSGRSRAVSVKDLHSCRHTFCYYSGLYGIPLSVVQSIVGHMTPEMTRHYSEHATLEVKKEKMKLLPQFMTLLPGIPEGQEESASENELKESLLKLIDGMDDTQLGAMIKYAQNLLGQEVKELPAAEEMSDSFGTDDFFFGVSDSDT